MLRQLASVLVRPYSNTFEWWWRFREITKNCIKAKIIPTFKEDKKGGFGKSQTVNLTFVPAKIRPCVLLEHIPGHRRENKVTETVSKAEKG